ncbi:stage 0 sporulation protein A [Clostridia bacterium]|nr:stage 0 sporulation protein A [Clostridia bacterium]
MEKIKIIIVEDNAQMLGMLENFLTGESEFEVAGTARDGVAAIKLIETVKPAFVLLDIVMPELDGFGVLEWLSSSGLNPRVMVLSALSQETFIHRALNSGADYYMIKPFDFKTLKARILEVCSGREPARRSPAVETVMRDYRAGAPVAKFSRTRSLEEKITNIFITVGIPAHIKGYQFLREAIKMAIDNPEIINCITKKLYPGIAEKFETSASKVERAIRHAIEVAWNRGKIENINSLFGVRVYSGNEKPTNGEFIALVADKMLIEGA